MAAELNLFKFKVNETSTRIEELKENIVSNKKRFLEATK